LQKIAQRRFYVWLQKAILQRVYCNQYNDELPSQLALHHLSAGKISKARQSRAAQENGQEPKI